MMLSDSLSDSFEKTNYHLLANDTREIIRQITTYFNWPHTVLSCITMFQLRLFLFACQRKCERGIWDEKVQQNLYTVKTLCSYLCISRATLYRVIQRGDLEPLRIGSSVRFTESEVNNFITRQQKQSRIKEVGF